MSNVSQNFLCLPDHEHACVILLCYTQLLPSFQLLNEQAPACAVGATLKQHRHRPIADHLIAAARAGCEPCGGRKGEADDRPIAGFLPRRVSALPTLAIKISTGQLDRKTQRVRVAEQLQSVSELPRPFPEYKDLG